MTKREETIKYIQSLFPEHKIEVYRTIAPLDFAPRIGLTIDGEKLKCTWNVEQHQDMQMTNKSADEELVDALIQEIRNHISGKERTGERIVSVEDIKQ